MYSAIAYAYGLNIKLLVELLDSKIDDICSIFPTDLVFMFFHICVLIWCMFHFRLMGLMFCQVSERALFFWNNDHIENLIRQNRKVILPIIFPALEKNSRNHWNQAVHSLTLNIRKIFYDFDPELYRECLIKFEEDESKESEVQSRRESTWKRLEEEAAKKVVASNEAVLVPTKFSSPINASPG